MTSDQRSDPAAAAALRTGNGGPGMTNDPTHAGASDAPAEDGPLGPPSRETTATAQMVADKLTCAACRSAIKEGEALIENLMGRRTPAWVHRNGKCEHQAIDVSDHPEDPAPAV